MSKIEYKRKLDLLLIERNENETRIKKLEKEIEIAKADLMATRKAITNLHRKAGHRG